MSQYKEVRYNLETVRAFLSTYFRDYQAVTLYTVRHALNITPQGVEEALELMLSLLEIEELPSWRAENSRTFKRPWFVTSNDSSMWTQKLSEAIESD